MEKIQELQLDKAELESLLNTVTRQSVKNILSIEINKVNSEIAAKTEALQRAAASSGPPSVKPKTYQVKLTNYAYDQTDKTLKFYVTIPNVQDSPGENVVCNFASKSLELNVKNLDNKDYVFGINNLLHEIDPSASSWKVKKDTVVVSCSKVVAQNWSHMTELEKKAANAKSEALAKSTDKNSADPMGGLMSLMKNMYDTGDDEMKRTIAKTWSESMNKTGAL